MILFENSFQKSFFALNEKSYCLDYPRSNPDRKKLEKQTCVRKLEF